ncbi:hypothetical protein [Parvularcula marina]|uniref:hypothetical protein n=1 Tax=Parvularcula marina TaxID=2292771 RepID=UPI00351224A8
MRHLIIIAATLALLGCGPEEEPTPTRAAAENYHRELRGYEYHEDVMRDSEGTHYYAQSALSGYFRTDDEDLPASLTELASSGCQIPRPEETDALYIVHIGGSEQQAPIHYITNQALNDAAERMVSAYVQREGDMPAYARFKAGRTMPITNVVVTEREKPVFLVLISQGDLIWSLQPAKGTQIRQIVALTPGMLGFAHLPEGTEVHSLYGRSLARCGIKPARMPKEHWSFVRNVKESSYGQDLLAENRKRARDFDRWMRETFDLGFYSAVEGLHLSNALIGPMPSSEDARTPYRPLSGSAVLLSPSDFVMAASKKTFSSQSETLVRQTATEAAGGSLSNLVARGN